MAPLQPAPAWDSVREWSPGLPCSRPRGGPPPAGHTTAQGSRPHLLCPGGHALAGGARPSTTPSTDAPRPGGPAGQGRGASVSSGPYQLWLYRRRRDPISPVPTKRPGGGRGASPREVGFRVCFPNKTTRTRALPGQAFGGLRATRGLGASARALPDARQGRCARRREGARGPDGADRQPAIPRPARHLPGGCKVWGPSPVGRSRRSAPHSCRPAHASSLPARASRARALRPAPLEPVNWNHSRRPRDSHNAQRAARHIPSRPRASGHPSPRYPAPRP